jgi:hypothetical protein
MKKLYKVNEWEDGTGKWRCNDTQDLSSVACKWWVPARILNISLTDYILLLKNNFKANIEGYYEPTDILTFSWENYASCHKYVLFINAAAKKANFII